MVFLKRPRIALTALALVLLAPVVASDPLKQPPASSPDWSLPAGSYSGQRYSALKQITPANVRELRPIWSFSTGVLRGHEGSPLVVGSVMYVHTPFPNIVYALDLDNDARILWKYEPRQDPSVAAVMCCDTVSRGLAYADDKLLLAQADTTLVALDAKTGRVIWSLRNGDPRHGETTTSAPLIVNDKVIIGIGGGEYGALGRLTAYALNDGRRLWSATSAGPDEAMLIDPEKTTELGKPVGKDSSLNSWDGDQWRLGGGPTWGWLTYDPALDLIFYGSGNPGTWNPIQRPGDNKWTDTIFARSATTGIAAWVYQMTPHDEWDYDGVNEMILADIPVHGTVRKALVHFDRNGFGYTLDRATGDLLVAEKFDPSVNWATGVDLQTGKPKRDAAFSPEAGGEDTATTGICPSALGAKNQQPAAFSQRTGLFYVPTNHTCMSYEPFHVSYTAGQPYVGATVSMFAVAGDANLGNFIAWDAGAGKIVWSNPERFSVWSGALATAGGVVFYGTLEGYLKAVDALTGRELYRFKTPSGIVGSPISYLHKGKQYVAILSGVGGWAGIGLAAGLSSPDDGSGAVGLNEALADYTALGGVLTVFALP
ncbi:MAG: methanol/ethanol family PQQ-dependent dehydrogenase [Hyphomicrobium sp.]|jgi:alcohol dehydrogenase (cytochrome c)